MDADEEYAVDVVKSDGDITRFYFDERGMAKTFSEIVEHAIGLSTTLLKRDNSGGYERETGWTNIGKNIRE